MLAGLSTDSILGLGLILAFVVVWRLVARG